MNFQQKLTFPISYIHTQKDINECTNFAESIDTSHYASRSQTDPEKRKRDQIVGKLGELCVYNVLKNQFPDITYPDFNIYKAKDKSWDFDLKASGLNLHVKSQDVLQGKKYGISWIFQASNGRRDYDKEIFDKLSPNQKIAFVSVDMVAKQSILQAIVDLDILHDKKLFKLPKVFKLQNANKLAVYFDDLKVIGDI